MQESFVARVITSCGDLEPERMADGRKLRVYRSAGPDGEVLEGLVTVVISDPEDPDSPEEAIDLINGYYNR